jgi:O-methyltransferase
MKRSYRNFIINAAGALLPDSDRLRGFAYTPMFRSWQKQHSEEYPVFGDRLELFDYVNQDIGADSPLQYLEFGVWEGASINHFADNNTHVESSFVGFDTFTGYSENWVDLFRSTTLEYFDMDGAMPEPQDPRVSFVKGMFQIRLL